MKNLYLRTSAAVALSLCCSAAWANTVLLSENFNGDYSANFPVRLELDHNHPANNVSPIFQNSEGVAQPWWPLKDSNASNDRFMTSHAIYTPAGKSNDWLQSRAIEIPTEGFNLSFGAQSIPFRSDESKNKSSLWVYITEAPLDKENLPAETALFIEDVPFGEKYAEAEGDFVPYTISLDKYAGKTIYISFANLNEDRDMLAIDDVLVERKDVVSLSVTAPEIAVTGDGVVKADISVLEAIGPWTLTLTDDNGYSYSTSGESMEAGTEKTFDLPYTIPSDKVAEYKVVFETKDQLPLEYKANMTCLAFKPWRNVLVEEATGLWCGNCPMGAYNMEQLVENDVTKEYAIPVSVHIYGTGIDMLVNETYAGLFGITAAPAYRVNRDKVVRYFSNVDDVNFNLDNPKSMGAFVASKHDELTTLEVSLSARFNNEADPTHIICEAKVNPALSRDASKLRIGFIMKENNVYSENSLAMAQHNYSSGDTSIESNLGGWTTLPKIVYNAKFHDVAREVVNYRGIENSLPAQLTANKEEKFEYTVEIPDTYIETVVPEFPNERQVGSPAIVPANVTMVAYVLDTETGEILNCAAFPMSPEADVRDNSFLTSGIDEIIDGADASNPGPDTYYDLQGRRISSPASGLFIRVRGGKAEKVFIP